MKYVSLCALVILDVGEQSSEEASVSVQCVTAVWMCAVGVGELGSVI